MMAAAAHTILWNVGNALLVDHSIRFFFNYYYFVKLFQFLWFQHSEKIEFMQHFVIPSMYFPKIGNEFWYTYFKRMSL